jgi:hypothetical protein
VAPSGLHHGSRRPAESRTYYDNRLRSASPSAELELARHERVPHAYNDLTLTEIAADHVYVPFKTVSSRAQRLRRQLGVRTRAETVAPTRERGTR